MTLVTLAPVEVPMPVEGHCDARFAALREALERNLQAPEGSPEEEVGAAIAVDIDGEQLVDMWGGFRDQARTQPWERDTIVNVWSTTKEITSLAVLILAEQGEVDLDAPVATYWPEFAQAGKDKILVRQVMSHTSGVAGWDQPFTVPDMYDWEKSTSLLAAQAPWWEPGTASGYHALNFGHLLGEVVRRVSGKSLKQFVAEEIAGPLGTDFQIGAEEQDQGRIAPVIPPPPLEFDLAGVDMDSPLVKIATGPLAEAAAANTEAWRRADIGAANGHSNARALARTMSVISRGGEVDGVRLLSDATISRIFEEQSNGVDLFLGVPTRFGIGYGLADPDLFPSAASERICYWGGWGGSVTMMFPDRKMTISYVMNRMGSGVVGSERTGAYLEAIAAAQ